MIKKIRKKIALSILRTLTGITKTSIPDSILKKAKNFRVEEGLFKFDVKLKINPSGWRGVFGSGK